MKFEIDIDLKLIKKVFIGILIVGTLMLLLVGTVFKVNRDTYHKMISAQDLRREKFHQEFAARQKAFADSFRQFRVADKAYQEQKEQNRLEQEQLSQEWHKNHTQAMKSLKEKMHSKNFLKQEMPARIREEVNSLTLQGRQNLEKQTAQLKKNVDSSLKKREETFQQLSLDLGQVAPREDN